MGIGRRGFLFCTIIQHTQPATPLHCCSPAPLKRSLMKRSYMVVAVLCTFILGSTSFSANPPNGVTVTGDGAGYVISFELPVFQQTQLRANGQDYINLSLPDYGVTSEVGFPALPIVSFNLMIAPEEHSVGATLIQQNTESQILSNRIIPAQEPWPKSRPLSERPFRINRDYYSSQGNTNQSLVSVSEPFVIAGTKGVTITFSPFTYNPAKNELVTVKRASVRIVLNNLPRAKGRITQALHDLLSSTFVNFDFRAVLGNGNYLIITSPDFESTMAGFVSFKQSNGYPVEVANTTVTGTTTAAIKSFIQQRYNNTNTRPEFILLVGDVDRIPEWTGSTTDNPHTDLFYVHLDGTDYYPDASIGRFAVSNTTELQNIIAKTVFMENSINGLPKKNVFMASTDNWEITEGTHNAVIDTFFQPHGYLNLKRYTHTYGATTSQLIADLNANQTFAIYSGHGAVTSWADGPPLSQSQVSGLVNTVFPFVYSFSCLTGQFQSGECFGETWIRIPTGGSTFWGSSVTSYWDEDDILEKRMVRAMFADSLIQSAPMFNRAKFYLASHYGGFTSTVKRYFEMYNLLGDPSMHTAPYTTNFGWARGNVTTSSAPLAGVKVDFVEPVIQQSGTSSVMGAYLAGAAVDSLGTTLTLRASKFGYLDFTSPVTIARHETTTVDVAMSPAAGGTLSVHAFRSDSSCMRANVRIVFGGSTVINDFTDSLTGCYTTPLPSGTYVVVVDPPSPYATRTFAGTVISAGQTTAVDALIRCVVEPSPVTLRDTVQVGGVHTQTLTLTNTTQDSVRYRITDELAMARAHLTKEAVQPRVNPIPAAERPKGAEDIEHSASPKGGGGPDTFGYRWIDSDSSGGPTFNWFDIDGIGTLITSWTGTTDDGYFATTLPWPFPFYGNDYTSLNIGTNGFVNFGSGSTAYSNEAIPSSSDPNNAIYAFWDDLTLTSRGRVTYYSDVVNSRFIVQYTGVPRYSGSSDSLSFQIMLEPNGEVKFQFLRMTSSALNSATIGIENAAGTIALQVVNSASYVHNNLAVRFYLPDAPWLSETPRYGVLAPDSSVNIIVTFDAGSLPPNSVNRADIHLIVTHPDVTGDIIVPAILNVRPTTGIEETNPATPTRFSLEQNYPNPFNPTTAIHYQLPQVSHVELKVYDLLGREVAMLVNEIKQPGTHAVLFDASTLASGIYYYRLATSSFSKVQKMIFIK
jgi:hypothetical protein